MLTIRDVSKATGATILLNENNSPVSFLITDSRKAVFNESSLFFAIKGRYHDGHDFIGELYKKGIRQFIIENKNLQVKSLPGSNFLCVENSIKAIQDVAAYHRRNFSLKVIGITGSNGKTIVKEWLSQLLSWKYNVIKSPKSFNSQIGVPLSVWQINENHEYGIFEAGISRKNEMQSLYEILKPEIGIFTNIGSAHDEGFDSSEQKIYEKLKLFQDSKLLVLCSDYGNILSIAQKILTGTKFLTWGFDKLADIHVSVHNESHDITSIQCKYQNRKFQFMLPFSDKASIENIMHCISLLLYMGWDYSTIQQGLNGLHRVSMRLELKKGINDCNIIDDTYSNDLVSLEIGLNFMVSQGNKNKKTLILSDILQTGLPVNVLYEKTAQLIKQYKIRRIIGIGESITTLQGILKGGFIHYPDVEHFLKDFKPDYFHNEIILVKGARQFSFERIITALQEKIHGTVLEIDLDAVIYNFNYFRAKLNPGTKIMIMVKALAYGNGILEIANLMQYHRADYLGVAFADEGVFLRKNGIGMPVMVMNPAVDSFDKILEFRLEPEIYSLSLLDQLIYFMEGKNRDINIHLKLDTGMHRLGIYSDQIDELITKLKNNKNIKVKSVFSHLAAADEVIYDDFTHQQAGIFIDLSKKIQEELGINVIRHIANSAGILRFPEYHFDMVRLGIGLYGLIPEKTESHLRPVSRLKTVISQVKRVYPGDSVGYGRRGKISHQGIIAIIAIGYADGFLRAFGNGVGHVWVKGHIIPVIGNVCMDMSMIDITDIDAKEGDEVIIFGSEYSIFEVATSINTIPYEILTNISDRVKRIYYKE